MSKTTFWLACDCKNGKHGQMLYRKLWYRFDLMRHTREVARKELKRGFGTHLVKVELIAQEVA